MAKSKENLRFFVSFIDYVKLKQTKGNELETVFLLSSVW